MVTARQALQETKPDARTDLLEAERCTIRVEYLVSGSSAEPLGSIESLCQWPVMA